MAPSAPATGTPAAGPGEAASGAAEETRAIVLTGADSRAFAEALLAAPREPGPRLRAAAKRLGAGRWRDLREAVAEARAACADLSPEEVEALADEAVAWARSGGGGGRG